MPTGSTYIFGMATQQKSTSLPGPQLRKQMSSLALEETDCVGLLKASMSISNMVLF